jgi:hypothetical protein
MADGLDETNDVARYQATNVTVFETGQGAM